MGFAIIAQDGTLSFDYHHPRIELFTTLLTGKPWAVSPAYDRSLTGYVAEVYDGPINVVGTVLLAAMGATQTRWAGPVILTGTGPVDISLRHRIMIEDLHLGIGQVFNGLPSGRHPDWDQQIKRFRDMAMSLSPYAEGEL